MGSLFFPQLLSGALAQYPIEKRQQFRTIANVLADGTFWGFEDAGAQSVAWHLTYVELDLTDINALRTHFDACQGPVYGFTFIDPTANMFSNSDKLQSSPWMVDPGLKLESGYPDPNGGTNAWRVTNTSQVPQSLTQRLAVPANYQYCFSLYASSLSGADLTMSRSGTGTTAECNQFVAGAWQRLVSTGRLNDAGAQFSAGISIGPGQQAELYGLQLEAQSSPSHYIPSTARGGVYSNAHWGEGDFQVVAQSPGWYATSFVIEAA
jgi:hypothetical protein